MNTKFFKLYWGPPLSFIFLLALSACGGGGGGGDDAPVSPPASPPADISGTWNIYETVSSNCGDAPTKTYTMTVTQSGSSVVVRDSSGIERAGTMNGNVLSWSGSYPEEGGTTTVSNLTLTFSENTMNGTSNFSWSDGSESCGGNTTLTGERTSGGGGSTTEADVAGLWQIKESVDARSCGIGPYTDAWTAEVTQQGSSISLLSSTGQTFTGSVNGNTLSWSGSYPEQGGTVTINSLNLTVSGNSMEGSSSWSFSPVVCSGTTQVAATRGSVTQEIEPNNTFGQSMVINPSVSQPVFITGTANSSTDTGDGFLFTLSSPGSVEFELSHFKVPLEDLELVLYDANTNVIASSSSSSSFEILERQLSAGVVYYIGVIAQSTNGVDAKYVLSIDVN